MIGTNNNNLKPIKSELNKVSVNESVKKPKLFTIDVMMKNKNIKYCFVVGFVCQLFFIRNKFRWFEKLITNIEYKKY